jgi:hypothetical protein
MSVLALAASGALACTGCAAQSEDPVEEQEAVVSAAPDADPQPAAAGDERTGEADQAFRGGGGGRGGGGRGWGGGGGRGWGGGGRGWGGGGRGWGGGWGGRGWGGRGWGGGWGGGWSCVPGSPIYPSCLGTW